MTFGRLQCFSNQSCNLQKAFVRICWRCLFKNFKTKYLIHAKQFYRHIRPVCVVFYNLCKHVYLCTFGKYAQKSNCLYLSVQLSWYSLHVIETQKQETIFYCIICQLITYAFAPIQKFTEKRVTFSTLPKRRTKNDIWSAPMFFQ